MEYDVGNWERKKKKKRKSFCLLWKAISKAETRGNVDPDKDIADPPVQQQYM